jgi:nicotinate phosphoribosyltransferase
VLRGGELVYEVPSLAESRDVAFREVRSLHPSIRRLTNPHVFPAGLEERLQARRSAWIADRRGER